MNFFTIFNCTGHLLGSNHSPIRTNCNQSVGEVLQIIAVRLRNADRLPDSVCADQLNFSVIDLFA